MVPTISLKVELLKPTIEKQNVYQTMTQTNTDFANWLLTYDDLNKATSKVFKLFSSNKQLPSAVVNQTIRDVKSQKRHQKAKKYKRLWCAFNNQNAKIEYDRLYKISFPTLEKRIGVPLVVRPFQQKWLDKILNGEAKQGTVDLFKKRGRWFVTIAISYDVEKTTNEKVLGIDLGLKNIATCSVGTKSLFFKGNQIAFKRRRFSSRRRQLGKLKKLQAIKKSKDKESLWMREMNHTISRRIIRFARSNGVGLIRMEDLTGIRMAKSKKEAGRNLNNWSFHQLQTFIQYKAEMAGITVEYVVPNYTSQTCKCGNCDKQNRNGLRFKCKKCSYKNHADLNASINIAKALSGISKHKQVI
ncbi:Nicotinate-nucleotide--dimethylbenzimidazole phosphoribosyltransferase [Lentibacillus sp. JNUCC-1]|nr:RNA-guided endonuclease TnpB family protein [Lentibacillus sp. JNUCC-1]MUV38314.1 Nicotinate-nucleotide--dimethylbenzimidazole phosphoribosyltransferase [Lentibacillus sp. JNUCC-1]